MPCSGSGVSPDFAAVILELSDQITDRPIPIPSRLVVTNGSNRRLATDKVDPDAVIAYAYANPSGLFWTDPVIVFAVVRI